MDGSQLSCTLPLPLACVPRRYLRLVCRVCNSIFGPFPFIIEARAPTEFLPGKRALAIGLCIYHVTCSTILFNAPRFIPHSLGPLAESCVRLLGVLRFILIYCLLFSGSTRLQKMSGAACTVLSVWALPSGGKPLCSSLLRCAIRWAKLSDGASVYSFQGLLGHFTCS